MQERTFEEHTYVSLLDPDSGQARMVGPKAQSEGIESMKSFMKGTKPFNEEPFLMTKFNGNQSNLRRIFIGKFNGKNLEIISTGEMNHAMDESKILLAVPGQDRLSRYHWLSVYVLSPENTVDVTQPTTEYKLDRERSRIENNGWRGIENQLFLDYFAGANTVDPTELKRFRCIVVSGGRLDLGRFSKGKPVFFTDKASLGKDYAGKTLWCQPQFDPERGYSWVEIVTDDASGVICMKGYKPGELEFYPFEGPEQQSIKDWIKGNMPITKTTKAKFPINNSKQLVLGVRKENIWSLNFNKNTKFSAVNEIIVVPREDRLYNWLDIYDPKSESSAIPLVSVKVIKGEKPELSVSRFFQGTIYDPSESGEASALNQNSGLHQVQDFLNGSLELHDLKPFILSTFKNKNRLVIGVQVNSPARKRTFIIPTPEMELLIKSGQKILMVPKEDVDKFYQWLDAYQLQDTNQIIKGTECIGSFRIHRESGSIMSKWWHGPEMQLLFDYLTDSPTVQADILKPFLVRHQDDVFVATGIGYQDKHITLSLQFSDRTLEQDIQIVPSVDRNGNAVLEAYDSQGILLKRFIYRKAKARFKEQIEEEINSSNPTEQMNSLLYDLESTPIR